MSQEGLTFNPVTRESALPGTDEAGEFAPELASLREAAPPAPWCSYLAYEAGRAVALGLFKAPPTASGEVEIAYLTFASHEGRGVAKRVAAHLVELAGEHGAKLVSAHTLPEENASTRVLQANSFVRDGWGEDEEAGRVWRWILPL